MTGAPPGLLHHNINDHSLTGCDVLHLTPYPLPLLLTPEFPPFTFHHLPSPLAPCPHLSPLALASHPLPSHVTPSPYLSTIAFRSYILPTDTDPCP